MKKMVTWLICCIVTATAPDGSSADTWRWENNPITPPIGSRLGHASVWTGQELLVWGGERIIGDLSQMRDQAIAAGTQRSGRETSC
jgi:hypothetical protein